MELITQRKLIKELITLAKQVEPRCKREEHKSLMLLDPDTATAESIIKIKKDDYWITRQCNECGMRVKDCVEIGEEFEDCEQTSIAVCRDCLKKALDLMGLGASKLDLLRQKCKCGVHVTINAHRDIYDPVERYLDDRGGSEELEIAPDVLKKMIELDTVVEVQFYPDTPIGFYRIFHHDLDAALAEALDIVKSQKGGE